MIVARRRCPSPLRRQRGYSLIEVIVAFALLALALTLLLGTLSGAARQVRWSSDAGRAALHAQSLLDQVGVGKRSRQGSAMASSMKAVIAGPCRPPGGPTPRLPPDRAVDPAAPELFELQLSVQWGDGRPGEQLQLRTLRLAAPGIEAVLP